MGPAQRGAPVAMDARRYAYVGSIPLLIWEVSYLMKYEVFFENLFNMRSG
jgi:hypothetical protein